MEPINLAPLYVVPMSCLYFNLPESECGRGDIAIAIEYTRTDSNPQKVHCWVWAEVSDVFLRGLVDEYEVPYFSDEDILSESIIQTLNSSKRYTKSLPGFIMTALELDSCAGDGGNRM